MTRFIQHTIEYHDDTGQVVVENCIVAGDPPEGWARFVAPVQFPIPGTTNGMAQGTVALPAESITEAFEMCRGRINAAIPKMQKQAIDQLRKQQKKLVVAGCEIPDDTLKKGHNGLKLSH